MLGRYVLLGAGYILALLVFQAGFLLKRLELPFFSSCGDVVASSSSSCWIQPSFKRAIWIVVDALRHDFVDPNADGRDEPGSHYFQHQMPSLEYLIRNEPENTMFARFIADPPTTTLQRLKGLTAGSLPTFIDAGANFAATSIGEDNVIDQILATKRNVTFLGDDTWVSLFPKQFHRAFHLPSFDINDLHSVDDMVLKNLFSELERPDWQLLIAHFLGVDHCGHKYGPDHPEMSAKLRQMDAVIANISRNLDEDTVLFVMGDHGMTSTGDHGGDSEDETVAAFFAYAKKKIVNREVRRNVYQVDFVPTLSLLLDFPIPFSNVGRLIEEFFSSSQLVKASKANCWQMVRFVQSYIEKQQHLKPQIDWILRDFENGQENDVWRNALVMRRLQEILREAWTSFDMSLMRVGLVSFAECLVFHVYLLANRANQLTFASLAIRSGVILLQSAIVLGNEAQFIVNALDMILVSSAVYYLILLLFTWNGRVRLSTLGLCGIVLFYCASMTSNSFLVYESSVLRFIIQTLFAVCAYDVIVTRQNNRRNLNSLRDFARLLFAGNSVKWIVLAVCVTRFCAIFERCREEQVNCKTTFFTGGLYSVYNDNDKLIRFAVGTISLLMTNLGFLWSRQQKGTTSVGWELSKASLWISVCAVVLHWTLQLLPDAVLQSFNSVSLGAAQFVYISSLLNCAYSIYTSRSVPSLIVGVVHSLAPTLMIVLGDGLALPLLALLVIAFSSERIIPHDSLRFIQMLFITLYGFYALSHHPALSAIPWQAAFIGIPGNFAIQAIPAFIVLLHIFASQFLVTFTLPLAMPNHTEQWIFGFLFLNSLKSFAVAGTAFIQRRHLMVWKIFAPKFIYDAISLITITVVSTIVMIVLLTKRGGKSIR